MNAFYKDVTSFDTNILKREQMRMIDRIFQDNLEPRYSVVIKDDTYDMQVTGLSLALGGEKSFLQHFLPKTISMKIKDSVSGNDKSLAKKVAKANEVSIDGEFTISGTNDFSSLKLKQDVVFSIKKPKSTNDNKAYQVYYIKDEDVYQVPTTQSDS
ncbi:MAG: cell wall-binding protein, partial [Longicatena sp.]